VVAADRIAVTLDGDTYEWISKGPVATPASIVPIESTPSWHLWVLHDRDYESDVVSMGSGFDERARNRLKRP